MLSFRVAKQSDIPVMVKIINAAYRGDPSENTWTSESHLVSGARITPSRLEEYMSDEKAWFVLMLRDETVIGSVYLKEESPDSLYLGMFAIQPTAQSSGLGKALLTHVAENARNAHYKRIRLTVIELRPELISYYERRGYVKTGKREPFPHSDCAEGIPLVDNLHVVEMIQSI